VVFTGGIGENDHWLRQRCCEGLSRLGIIIDAEKNQTVATDCAAINAEESGVKVLVVHTQEELEIALQAQSCIAPLANT